MSDPRISRRDVYNAVNLIGVLTEEEDWTPKAQLRTDRVMAVINRWTADQCKRADTLQARLDAAVTVTEEMLSQLVSGPERRDAEAIHEALTGGEQPPEPKPRCCIGPFADGAHAVNCWQRCQDCGGDDTTCHCREAGSPTEVQP